MTFLSRNSGPAIARIPKNASQSISMVMAPCDSFTNDEALAHDVRVAFIRDPFDRLASAYSFFSWLKEVKTRVNPPLPEWDGYEQFIDWALDSDDHHVKPQYELLLSSDGRFVPNRIHRLRDIRDIWGEYYPGIMPDKEDFPHRNSCQRLATTDYRRGDIAARYSKDLELCHQF